MLIEKRTRVHFNLAKCVCGSYNLTIFEDKYPGLKLLYSIACGDCGKKTGRFADINMCVIEWNGRFDTNWYPLEEE